MSEENKTQETQEAQAPQITLEDIVVIQKIIQLASSRGAFKAEEMSAVGRTYDRVNTFLEYNAPKKEEGSEETGETTANGDEQQ